MTKKSCLNCAYLCTVNNDPDPIPMAKNRRAKKTNPLTAAQFLFLPAFNAKCFFDEWVRATDMHRTELERKFISKFGVFCAENWTNIWLNDESWLALDKYKCSRFQTFDANSDIPLDCLEQEHQQRGQQTRYRRRFWIPTGISIAAIIIAGLSLWGGQK